MAQVAWPSQSLLVGLLLDFVYPVPALICLILLLYCQCSWLYDNTVIVNKVILKVYGPISYHPKVDITKVRCTYTTTVVLNFHILLIFIILCWFKSFNCNCSVWNEIESNILNDNIVQWGLISLHACCKFRNFFVINYKQSQFLKFMDLNY
jgi:hypothetical protein